MNGVDVVLIFVGFALAVPLILVNSFLWLRFTRLYRTRSSEKMPFLLVDFSGRWQRVLSAPHADPTVEGVRRQLWRSQLPLFVPIATAVIGAVLASGPR